jgi:transposase-like protein
MRQMHEEVIRVCPNPECRYHNPEYAAKKRWYRPHGYYTSPAHPEQQHRRYRCSTCGRTFSETYFTRNWHLQQLHIDEMDLLFEWCKGTPVSALALRYHCSSQAIEKRIERMQLLAEEKSVVLEVEVKGKIQRIGAVQ